MVIGESAVIRDNRAGKMVVNLTGKLNQCGAISPRCEVQLSGLEKWQNNPSPSHQVGFIVLTTSAGLTDCEEERPKHIRREILSFFLEM